MPELPEVETITKQLNKAVCGRKIQSLTVRREKSFQGNIEDILGVTITAVTRHAKVIIFHFENDFPKIIIHLKMTGQLIYEPINSISKNRIVGGHPTLDWVASLPSIHTRLIIFFDDESKLFLNDQRVFGWIKVIQNQQQLQQALKSLNPVEPLTPLFTLEYLVKICENTRRPIKIILMDQSKIGGIGNIYANDALFKAGIHPQKRASSLTQKDYKRLLTAVNETIALGIQLGGATDSDYRQLDGMGGSYQHHFLVYNRADRPCSVCKTLIQKIKIGGRGSFFCPQCQV